MRSSLTENDNDKMYGAMGGYKQNPNNEGAFQLCIGSYICGDEIIRQLMEEELKDTKALMAAKKLVKEKELGGKNEIIDEETTWVAKVRNTANAPADNSRAHAATPES
ncbi:MAG: hypothetical protein LBP39_00500 [Rickettsiales bacterium]|jgi:hypothetical protein|nr:hypothetical protein [Rickettsiales bacterium]